ncbi:MAG: hypothetical protein JWM33_1608 [Caulobacteraceae bacterium]|nr:hypothetical protein [Caulobacteraceae bacterium]
MGGKETLSLPLLVDIVCPVNDRGLAIGKAGGSIVGQKMKNSFLLVAICCLAATAGCVLPTAETASQIGSDNHATLSVGGNLGSIMLTIYGKDTDCSDKKKPVFGEHGNVINATLRVGSPVSLRVIENISVAINYNSINAENCDRIITFNPESGADYKMTEIYDGKQCAFSLSKTLANGSSGPVPYTNRVARTPFLESGSFCELENAGS